MGTEVRDEEKSDVSNLPPSSRNGGLTNMTPRSVRSVGRSMISNSECGSAQTTPSKSITKPPNPRFASLHSIKNPMNFGSRAANFAALAKGVPLASSSTLVVNTVEVPHFELREDPSFWMDHNVQVLIRVRPLNGMERSSHGYTRCLKQENVQSVAWIGQPETRFTFDHVACETINQEMLFRVAGLPMVENCLSGYNSCMFAYGQTGSGKTYTMLGEIDDLEVKPSPERGMTPRIFEFLFARIRAEEESRRDKKVKYSCKCSFLEIYNEQICDLLDPSSTNLLLREDIKNGVYVENLTEYEVQTVNDILKLLAEGAANRKVAATNMNRESSRSHSVFTCVIESRWEKESTTNLRFARLNLVDLAGSERQKTSGAEGERLKEAANINKSLSTLGHVIMLLVDVAQGKKIRHIPYRDSRLTFLLQESLGGNSKTMIIANVSPSICCAAETLSTLKFAQRAKLIQNNAVINEDASGDVSALQHQIQMLKLKSLEATLAGALRREQMADSSIKQLEAEIEQLNRLVNQREEDTCCTKMMLRFREDKIQKMEVLLGGSMTPDAYLAEENDALSKELQLLHAKIERNPEVTRFALENVRLLDKLRKFQDFYEEGEREMLSTEVSELRNQLLQFLDGNKEHYAPLNVNISVELKKSNEELELCRRNLSACLESNSKLTSENDDLKRQLNSLKSTHHDQDSCVKKELIYLKVEANLEKQLLMDTEVEVSDLKNEIVETNNDRNDLTQKLQQCSVQLLEMELEKGVLEEDIQSLKEVVCSNDRLKSELVELLETKETLTAKLQQLETESVLHIEDGVNKETALKALICDIQTELDHKDARLNTLCCMEKENATFKDERIKLEADYRKVLDDLQEKKYGLEASYSRICDLDQENHILQDKISNLGDCIAILETDSNIKNRELEDLRHSQLIIEEKLEAKDQDLEIQTNIISSLKDDNASLKSSLISVQENIEVSLSLINSNVKCCVDLVQAVDDKQRRFFQLLDGQTITLLEKMFHELCENRERASKLIMECEILKGFIEELTLENLSFKNELLRKDELVKGLSFDLSLLQESASIAKKDETEELEDAVEHLEEELVLRSNELNEAVIHNQILEAQFQEKCNLISDIELDLFNKSESLKLLMDEKDELTTQLQRWLEEINRRQAEMVAAQIASERLRQRDQFFTTENDMLKKENVSHKKKVMELEDEVKKLTGQQNLHQRIHHHAKIKEENNLLKAQNEELSIKVRKMDVGFSRLKEEIANYRAARGKNCTMDFDEEKQLTNKLKETEEEKLQMAQKLLSLCTSILKTAGITQPAPDISLYRAEEALDQLKDRIISMERELHDLKLKSKICSKRAWLSELKQQLSPLSSRTDENSITSDRVSQTPFLSTLDRKPLTVHRRIMGYSGK